MASGAPVMNGDVMRGTLEETLHQINKLIQENRELKEALRQTNMSMKERFEGLSVWKDKQSEDREFLEQRLEEARGHMEALTAHNQELSRKVEELERGGGGAGGGGGGGEDGRSQQAGSATQGAELEALRAQLARLQAEKNDLVAMNSELQLKASQGASEDSFIEVIRVDGGVASVGDLGGAEGAGRLDSSMTVSRLESEEVTVHQLLQSLRNETQRVEALQIQLQASEARQVELQQRMLSSEISTQTSLHAESPGSGQQGEAAKEELEVEALRSQMMALFKELQQAQSKLDEAEAMKRKLQERCREVEQDVSTLRSQLTEKQAVQAENERLRLQLDTERAQSQVEQRKGAEERNTLAQLKDAYTKLFEDYDELKEERKKREVPREQMEELQLQLSAAEEALAKKQQQIDTMKQEIYRKEGELETISVFQAQAEVYSSDFYAERAAREKIHEEKERLAAQLEFVKLRNSQLQEEMDSLGRQSLNEMQKRHVSHSVSPHGGVGAQGGRGADVREWQDQGSIPEHACPKCNEVLPDLDSLQIHIMDCII